MGSLAGRSRVQGGETCARDMDQEPAISGGRDPCVCRCRVSAPSVQDTDQFRVTHVDLVYSLIRPTSGLEIAQLANRYMRTSSTARRGQWGRQFQNQYQ